MQANMQIFFSLQMPYKQEANKNPAEFTEN